jgi:hypothetical protein
MAMRLDVSNGTELEAALALTPLAGPVRVLARGALDEVVDSRLAQRASSLPASYYFELYLSTPNTVLPPCSAWYVDGDGNASDGALLVDGELGLRALSEYTRRARGSRGLRTLALWLRGDFAADFDRALFIDLSIARSVLLFVHDGSLRLQQALARAVARREPSVYAVPSADEINCAVFAFMPRLHSFLTRRRGDMTAERAVSEYLERVHIAQENELD